MFTFTDRISVRREASDGAGDDEAIAKAIAEESNAADECLTADRKLTEKVNKAIKGMIQEVSYTRLWASTSKQIASA